MFGKREYLGLTNYILICVKEENEKGEIKYVW